MLFLQTLNNSKLLNITKVTFEEMFYITSKNCKKILDCQNFLINEIKNDIWKTNTLNTLAGETYSFFPSSLIFNIEIRK